MMEKMAEKINEPIEVWASFARGKLQPLRFQWQGRSYLVRQTEFVHSTYRGLSRVYYFSVVCPQARCQLAFDSQTFGWRLMGVEVEGV